MRYGRGYSKPALGRPIALGHPQAREVVLDFPLTEGAGVRLNDVSGNGNYATIYGCTWVGDDGHALNFDGNDYGVTEINPSLDINGPISLAVRLKTSQTGKYAYIVCNDHAGADSYYYLRLTNADELEWYIFNGSTGVTVKIAGYSDGKWHDVVGTYDGSTMRIYVDGRLKDEDTQTGYNALDSDRMWLGKREAPSTDVPFEGKISSVVLYKTCLSLDAISHLHSERYGKYRRR